MGADVQDLKLFLGYDDVVIICSDSFSFRMALSEFSEWPHSEQLIQEYTVRFLYQTCITQGRH